MRVSSIRILVAVAVVAVSGVARAATFVPVSSAMTLRVASADPIQIGAQGGTEGDVSLGAGGRTLSVGAGVFQTVNMVIPTSLLTPIPDLSGARVTVTNDPGSFATPFASTFLVGPMNPNSGTACASCFGGAMPLSGQLVLTIFFQEVSLPFGPSLVGSTGTNRTTKLLLTPYTITLMGDPFITGPVAIMNLSTPKVSITTGPRAGVTGAVISLEPDGESYTTVTVNGDPEMMHTVTVRGANLLSQLSTGQTASVTFVAPMRIETGGLVGNIPAVIKTTFTFIPEPELNLLVVSAVGILALLGRGRIRRR
jgi:hypothetical protein